MYLLHELLSLASFLVIIILTDPLVIHAGFPPSGS